MDLFWIMYQVLEEEDDYQIFQGRFIPKSMFDKLRGCPDDSALNCKKKLSALCSDDSAPSFYRFGTNQPGVNF
jgi:hypothetical protein